MNRSSLRFSPNLESLDERLNLSASPLPVLMVIADRQDFVVAETRPHTGGVNVALADGSVRSVNDSHVGVGILKSTDGGPTFSKPATAADDVIVDGRIITGEDYSGVVFVGGWGSSMYQY